MDATRATWTNDATQDAFDYASYPNDSAQRAQLREHIKKSARVGKRGQFTRTGELKPEHTRTKSTADISGSMTGAVANYLRDNLVAASADVRSGSFSAYLVIAAVGRIDWPQLAERLICKYMPDEYVPVA